MFQTDILRNPINASPELRNFFYSHSPTFFQNLCFLTLLNGVTGFRPFMIILRNDRNIIATLAGTSICEGSGLKAWASERTVIYGHPVIDTNTNPALVLTALLKELKHLSRGSLFIQCRNDTDQKAASPVFHNAGFRLTDRLNLIKPIDNLNEAWAALSASRKRQINNSRKNGVEIIEMPTLEQLHEFYRQLQTLYKNKVRKPLPSLDFFERFYFLSTGDNFNGRVILCDYEGKIVSGILCPFTPGASIYEWYVCGLDKEYRSKKIYPSIMVTWAAMEIGNSLGCSSFDFMGLGIPTREYGVRDFKARFSGNWVNHGRWSRVNNPMLYSLAELGYNVLRLIKKI